MAGGTASTVRAWRRVVACGLSCVVLAGLGGCGGKPKKAKTGGGTAGEKLPAVDLDTALAVDDGRIAAHVTRHEARADRSQPRRYAMVEGRLAHAA